MPEMIEEIKNLGKQIEESVKATTEAQKAFTEHKSETNSTVQTAVEAAAKAGELAQEMKQKMDATEKAVEFIEKSLSRMPGTTDDESKGLEAKAKDEMIAYMRKRTPMSEEVVEATSKAIIAKSFHGVTQGVRDNEVKDLIAGSNPDGGYWIRPERSAMMIKRIFETSVIRSIANIQTTASDSVEFIIDDDEVASGGWVGEVDTRGDTATGKIGKLTIPVHEQFSQPKATQKMLDDAGFDIESWLAGKVTDKMSRVENTAFVVGDGSQKPKGFLSLPAWTVNGTYQRGALEQIDSGINGQFAADSIKLLQNSLIENYQTGAIFGLKRASWQQVIILKDGQGQYLLDPRSMKVGDTLTLLGKGVMFMDDMPVAANDSLSMVYGNFGVGYTIIDRMGFRILRDPYTQKGVIKFYTTKRTGGAPTNYEAIKIYKLAV